jgi:hypothetical protein
MRIKSPGTTTPGGAAAVTIEPTKSIGSPGELGRQAQLGFERLVHCLSMGNAVAVPADSMPIAPTFGQRRSQRSGEGALQCALKRHYDRAVAAGSAEIVRRLSHIRAFAAKPR